MYFYRFCQTFWLFTGIPLSFIYTYFIKKLYIYNLSKWYCYKLLMLLLGRISAGAIINHHLMT